MGALADERAVVRGVAYIRRVHLGDRYATVCQRVRRLPLGVVALMWAAFLFALVVITSFVSEGPRLTASAGGIGALISIGFGAAVVWTLRRRWREDGPI